MGTAGGLAATGRAIACAFFLLACASAFAQTVTERARGLMREGKAQEAYDLLEPQADQLSDAESAYLLGIAALDIGKAGLAVMAFERALAYDPGFAVARAELARALIQTGAGSSRACWTSLRTCRRR
jgi:tetratricopeptide (TPR) repeat protein